MEERELRKTAKAVGKALAFLVVAHPERRGMIRDLRAAYVCLTGELVRLMGPDAFVDDDDPEADKLTTS